MADIVDVYWSFRSPYSYLATARLRALSANAGINVRPIIVRPIALRDPDFFARCDPRWIEYVLADAAREAERLGLRFVWPAPDPISQNLETRVIEPLQPLAQWLCRIGVAAIEAGQGWPFLDEVSQLIWSGTSKWNESNHFDIAVERAGLSRGSLEAIVTTQSSRLDAQIVANEVAQNAAGHWGVPFMVYKGERFFGQDRVDSLIWRLESEGWLDGARSAARKPATIATLCRSAEQHVEVLPVEQIQRLLHEEDIVLVDVREKDELRREGTIPGAFHAPRGLLEFWIDPASPYAKTIFAQPALFVFFCAKGGRSALAAEVASRMGIARVCHMAGGFDAWSKGGFPTQPLDPRGRA
ncbi:MAG: rhodanese-like domain-containing protein [Hyphomonadaceae bacterium]|jgi:2-hydroxychromene-2-carboxylate isomerase/rhodanese-related sulfurtransferase|nr:DsbA family protein [Hyphomonadaceae bacterium]MCZ8195771.1 DsbA family protein [Aquidulcibacter sp.]